jgi:Ring finger domain
MNECRSNFLTQSFFVLECFQVVQKGDLFYGKDLEADKDNSSSTVDNVDGREEGPPVRGKHEAFSAKEARAMSLGDVSEDEFMFDTDDEEIGESGKPNSRSCLVPCDESDEHAHLYLRLPPKNATDDKGFTGNPEPDSQTRKEDCTSTGTLGIRHVDGQCALCIDDYEEGDKVAWSDLECPHAFHQECITQWLGKGKKRCPVCRHWFVPGARIDDQKKAHGEAWELALAEMIRREKQGEEDAAAAAAANDQPQHQQEEGGRLVVESREEAPSAEITDPTDSDTQDLQPSDDRCGAVGTKGMSNDEDHPCGPACRRRSSEESDMDAMLLHADKDEMTTRTLPSGRGLDMDDLESQPVASDIVQNTIQTTRHPDELLSGVEMV